MLKGAADLYIAIKFMKYFEYFKKVKIAKMEEKGKYFTRKESFVSLFHISFFQLINSVYVVMSLEFLVLIIRNMVTPIVQFLDDMNL